MIIFVLFVQFNDEGLQKSNTLEQNVLEASNLAKEELRLLLIAQDSTYGTDLLPNHHFTSF